MTRPDAPTTLRTCIGSMAPIGTALIDAAARLSYIRELLPKRGELVEEFSELVTTLAWIETAYRDADEALLDAYRLLEHAQRVPNPQPLIRSDPSWNA